MECNIIIFPKLSLILGGAASGKSHFAERLTLFADRPKTYVATAQAFDAEMEEKILQHQKDRGPDWMTIEVPFAVPEALISVPESNIILLDCLTLWLTNQILAENDLNASIRELSTKATECASPIIAVSNEVGHSIVPDTPLGRRFQREQGKLNAQMAQQADLVVMVTAGLPQVLKGNLPEGFQ